MSKWSILAEKAWAAGDEGSPQLRRRASDSIVYARDPYEPPEWVWSVGDWHHCRRDAPRGLHDHVVTFDENDAIYHPALDLSPRALLRVPVSERPSIDVRISARAKR